MIPFVLLACSALVDPRDPGDHLDTVVAGAGAGLTRVSCVRKAQSPAHPEPNDTFGCLYRGSPDAISKLLAQYGAAPNPPRTNRSSSPCVRKNPAIGVLLPGSDDWYTKDGVETFWPAVPLPTHPSRTLGFGDVYVSGDHVCLEVVEPAP